jgi:hypothetical protein
LLVCPAFRQFSDSNIFRYRQGDRVNNVADIGKKMESVKFRERPQGWYLEESLQKSADIGNAKKEE